MNRVAIIILNWNCAEDSIECANSLLGQTVVPDIIFVDNNSSDDSVERIEEYIRQKGDSITLIKNPVNSGFTGGINVGVRTALKKEYEFIGTLNPDATADSRWVEYLTNEFTVDKSIGITTGILARTDKKTLDTSGDFYTTWGIPGPRGRDGLISDAPQQHEYIFGATGGGFIAQSEVFRQVGLLDEVLFMYFEDVDFCFRAQLAGYKVRYTPGAIAYHKLSASTNKVPGLAVRQTFKNLPVVFLKNVPTKLMFTILPRFMLAYLLILGNSIVHGRGLPALQGWLLSLWLIPHSLKKRHEIQSNKKVSAAYIASIILHDIPLEQTGLRNFRAFFTGKK
ncbi:glycosyltransferase family 2 protein [Candidatus Saccharibacteria bacterium]|nr:glycosyltransferase family 2 protein [Candidatus Saccharibacteria bacterium]